MKPCHLIFSPKLGVNAISFGIYNKMSPFGHLAFLGTTGVFFRQNKNRSLQNCQCEIQFVLLATLEICYTALLGFMDLKVNYDISDMIFFTISIKIASYLCMNFQ